MKNKNQWKKSVVKELSCRLGESMLLLLEDRRLEKGFHKDVSRWIFFAFQINI